MLTTHVAAQRAAIWLGHLAIASLPLFFAIQTMAFWGSDATVERVFIGLTCLAAFQAGLAAAVRGVSFGAAERRCFWLVAALALWIAGQIATLVEGSVSGTEGSLHSSVLLFSLFGMPILALTSTNRASHPSRATYYLDGVTVALLTYAFSTYNADVIAQSLVNSSQAFDLISRNFAIEGLLLALVSLARMVAAESTDDRGFFFVLSEFLVIELVVATFFNYIGADSPILVVRVLSYGLLPLPFLLLASRLCRPLPRPVGIPTVRPSVRAMLLSLSPSALTIVLVLLAVQIMKAHGTLGALLLTMAIVCYVVRNMITQSWFIQNRDALVESEQALRTMTRTDPLTGIGNRRLFNEALDVEWERAARTQSPLALLMIDVDAFKAYNDTYGHDEGDRCLKRVALALRVALPRAGDVVARYGGEEFVALLPNTPASSAGIVAQRLCDHIAGLHLPHSGSPHQVVTVSIGVSAIQPDRGELYQTLVNAADRALYSAKAEGRNRITLLALALR